MSSPNPLHELLTLASAIRAPPAAPVHRTRPPLRDRKFADSLLEQSGFELWVPPACDAPGSHKVRC
jgi:hypothetical protein